MLCVIIYIYMYTHTHTHTHTHICYSSIKDISPHKKRKSKSSKIGSPDWVKAYKEDGKVSFWLLP